MFLVIKTALFYQKIMLTILATIDKKCVLNYFTTYLNNFLRYIIQLNFPPYQELLATITF